MKKFIILGVLGAFAFVFFITFVHVATNASGRNVSRLQRVVENKEANNQYLELEVLRLSGPQVVIPFAQEQLGLVLADPQKVVVLRGDKK